ncbi:phage baseplate assembly protein V [Nocardioides sp.]|uniref:phage baseplate assembly protein V n=1 Tax=Nocardioides sp. TaxID=35761 RepID=UPI00351619BC
MPLAVAPILTINGTLLTPQQMDKLRGLRVHREFGLVGRATLRFQDPDYVLARSTMFKLWSDVQVTLPPAPGQAGNEIVFKGEITGVALDAGVSGMGGEVVVTADDFSHRLTRGTVQETSLDKKVTDVVSVLTAQAGMTNDVTVISDQVHPYLLTTGSAMDVLNDLMRRANGRWICRPDSHTMTVRAADAPGRSGPTLTMGEQLQRFSVRFSALGLPKSVVATGWDVQQTQPIEATSTPPQALHKSDFLPPPSKLGAQGEVVTLNGTNPTAIVEARALASARLTEGVAGAVTARGALATGDGRIDPGVTVTVQGAGPSSGTYLVTAVEHLFDADGLRTQFTAGSHRPASMVDLLHRPSDDAGLTRDRLVVGVVTNNQDEKNLGRVKVKYVVSGQGGAMESEWARIVTPDAGASRGFVFLPEVNDEVLVGFEHGDTRRPIVLGSIFSAKVGLPSKDKSNVKNGRVEQRRITSRSGHMIEFDDTARAEQVLLLHKAGPQVLIQERLIEVKGTDVPIRLTNGRATVELKPNGDVVIECLNLKINAQMNVEVKGTQITAKANAAAVVEGAASATLKGANVAVEGQAVAQIKAGIVKVN